MAARPSDAAVRALVVPERWRGRAFGIEIDAPRELVGVANSLGEDATRRTSIEFITTEELDELWGAANPVRVFERFFSDCKPMLTVDHDTLLGYRVWAPRYGRHLVSSDGRRISSALPRRSSWWWQRLVLAQVLPIAATLQGLELLHASAVAFDGEAIAITAEAGTGKTSLAAHLLDLGGTLLADDVLALEVGADHVLAHPGVGLVNIHPAQRQALGPRASGLLAETLGQGDKSYVLAPVADRPVPLGAVYFLQRTAEFETLRIVEPEPDARMLLGSAFISYVDAEARLLTHLDVYSRIAQTTPPFVIEAPLDVPAAELAAHLVAHGREGR